MGLLLYVVAPDHSWWMPKCPMKLLTGLSCPGCGIQRALHAALHGEWGRAVAYNYYLIYALPYALSVFVAWLLPDGPRRDRLRGIVENRWAVGFFVVSYMVWLVVRNILNI
jgi:hypothetical protein